MADRLAVLKNRLAVLGPERFWMSGLVDDRGFLVASLKCYALELRIGGRASACLGLGAIFTRPEHRGRGLAPELVARVRESNGFETVLLFSDIGVEYYEKLGFRAFQTQQRILDVRAEARGGALRLEASPARRELIQETLAFRERFLKNTGIWVAQSAQSWGLFHEINAIEADFMLTRDGHEVGLMIASRDEAENALLLDELLYDRSCEATTAAVWDVVQRVARNWGLSTVRGWDLPAHGWPARAARMARPKEIAMIGAQDPQVERELKALSPVAHLARPDHF